MNNERNLLAISIKHTEHRWKFGKPCVLWGSRTQDGEKRSFGGYTIFPKKAELYSLSEWQNSGYGAGNVCKVDEPVELQIGFCKKFKRYDTVLVRYDDYINYCKCACLSLDGEDVVKVVRCKDCIYYHPAHILTNNGEEKGYEDMEPEAFDTLGTGLVTSEYGINVGGQCERNRYDADDKTVFCGPDDFCSRGQRREGSQCEK